MLVSLEAVCFWKTLCINLLPKRSSRLETSRERERERDDLYTLKSDFKIQKSREMMEFQKSNVLYDVL
jgi:hypothetical protein